MVDVCNMLTIFVRSAEPVGQVELLLKTKWHNFSNLCLYLLFLPFYLVPIYKGLLINKEWSVAVALLLLQYNIVEGGWGSLINKISLVQCLNKPSTIQKYTYWVLAWLNFKFSQGSLYPILFVSAVHKRLKRQYFF